MPDAALVNYFIYEAGEWQDEANENFGLLLVLSEQASGQIDSEGPRWLLSSWKKDPYGQDNFLVHPMKTFSQTH